VATATTVTYQSGPRKSDKRTVLVENVARQVVLLPAGRLEILTAKLLHGQTCRHEFWMDAIGADADTFAVAADQVVRISQTGPVRVNRNCQH
jgi:hypothetical protein